MTDPFLLLNESELRAAVGLDASALAVVEDSLTYLARGEVDMPMPMGIEIPEHEGEVHVKSAYIKSLPGFAVKIASGFYRNPGLGLPTSSGMMILLSSNTGFPMAMLLDNAYLTDVRTALAGAVAAKHLAPANVRTVGVVGTGVQARLQVQALQLVRSFRNVVVWGRRPEAMRKYVKEVSETLGLDVVPAASVSEVVHRSELVVTTTPARTGLVKAADLHPGLHITAMGSDGPGKQELEPAVLARADRLVCDRKSQCFVLGELQHGLAAGTLDEASSIDELGEITAGIKRGRTREDEISVCDLTGVGTEDTAIALFALRLAKEKGLGTTVNS
jgi:ectoine utilization protein EutC